MKPLILLSILLAAGCSARPVRPVIPATAPASGQISITVHLCAPNDDAPDCAARLAKWQRLKDEKDLIAFLLQDFTEYGHDHIDLALWNLIDALEIQIKKESR